MKKIELNIPENVFYSKDISPVDLKVYLFFLSQTSEGSGAVVLNTSNICRLLNISRPTYNTSYKKLLDMQLLAKTEDIVFARVYENNDYQSVDIEKYEYLDMVKNNELIKGKCYSKKQLNLLGYLYYMQAEYNNQVKQDGYFFQGLNNITKKLNLSYNTVKKYLNIFKNDSILDYETGGRMGKKNLATKFYLGSVKNFYSFDTIGTYNPDELFEEETTEIKEVVVNYSEEEIKAKQEEKDSFINYMHGNKEKLFQNIENIDLGITGDKKKMLDRLIENGNKMNNCIEIIQECININNLLYVLPKINNNVFTQAVQYYSTDTEKIKELKQYA